MGLKVDPIITMDSGGTIQSASDAVEPLFGWTSAELCGKNFSVLIPEPRRSALDRYLDRYRVPGKGALLKRVRRFNALRKDGSSVPIELSVSRADLPGQAGVYFIGLIRDVSGMIDTEADTPEERTRLQHFITEQTRALATAHLRLQLADRLAALGTLAAGLGHDLNNVLLPVRARLNAIEHAGITDGARKHLNAVRQSLDYLQHLSDGLHFLSLDPRGEADANEVGEPTHLATWWSHVGSLLRTAVPKHVKVTASLPRSLPSVGLSAHWLTQAMLNIIVNAGEAIAPDARAGRVTITALVEPAPRMARSTRASGATVPPAQRTIRLSVTDNGRGMTPEIRRKALDPFFTTKSRALGTGLGLPLARKIVDRCGGHIELLSAHGRGTEVVIVLPAAPAHTTPARARAAITVADRHRAMLIAQMLAAAGFEIVGDVHRATGRADAWVTEPSPATLKAATRWKIAGPGRNLFVSGLLSHKELASWRAINAVIVPTDSDLAALRKAIAAIPPQREPIARSVS